MKLTDNQKVVIYASALQGAIVESAIAASQGAIMNLSQASEALHQGDELIKLLEARSVPNDKDVYEEVADA